MSKINKTFKYLTILSQFTFLKIYNCLTPKDKNRVFVIAQTPNDGGTKTYFYYLMEYLLKRKYEIHLLVDGVELKQELTEYCRQQKMHLYSYNNTQIFDNYYYPKRFTRAFSHFTYRYLKQVVFLLKLQQKIKQKKTIVSAGWPFTFFFIYYINGKVGLIQHSMPLHEIDWGNGLYLKIALWQKSNKMVAISEFAKSNMSKYWFINNKDKIDVVYNYVESKCLDKKKKSYIRVLALARVDDGKNPVVWIETAEEILKIRKNVRFLWAGDGSLLKACQEKTNGNENISFVGFRADVDELYAQSDIYFEPSKREAQGISVLGAMANAVPPIATSNGGTVESVQDGVTGFIVDVMNKEMMIDRLLKLIDSEKLRKEMGQKSRERYEKMFTREIWEARMDIVLS